MRSSRRNKRNSLVLRPDFKDFKALRLDWELLFKVGNLAFLVLVKLYLVSRPVFKDWVRLVNFMVWVCKVLVWGLKASEALKQVLVLLVRWALRQQILVRHNNKQTLAVLGFKARWATFNSNENKTLSTSRSRTLRLQKRCRSKGWLATTLYFVATQHLRHRLNSIKPRLVVHLRWLDCLRLGTVRLS